MGTISSMSPRLAYSNGGLWVSTYDEYGRRCWVNNATGERTYGFDYGGRPVDPKLPPTPTNGGTVHYTAPNGMAYAYTLPGPVPAAYPTPNAHPVPSPGGAEVVPYYQMGCYQAGVPPVASVPAGRTNSNSEHYYIRPTFEKGSWMWK